MDFGKVLSRAWEITWRWKVLWILGFLASLGQGWGSTSSSYSFDGQDLNVEGWTQGPPEGLMAAVGGLLVVLCCLFVVLAIVIWVVSIIARGALIAGVVQVEDEGQTTFRRAWTVGFRRFWTLFGLSLLAGLPILILVIVGLILFGLGIAGGVSLMDVQEGAGITTIVMVSLLFVCFLCCGLVALALVLDQIRVYGERAAILEGLGWIEAFRRGWQVLKENLGATIVIWMIFFVLGLVIAAISVGLVLLLVVPFMVVLDVSDSGAWALLPLLCGGLIGLVLFALVRSVLTAFTSATWTLAFRDLTAGKALVVTESAAT